MKIARFLPCLVVFTLLGAAQAQKPNVPKKPAAPAVEEVEPTPEWLIPKALTPEQGTAQIEAVRGLITRMVPRSAGKFVIETLVPEPKDDTARDVFELQTQDGKVVLRGNSGVALASALNYYLKYYCNSQISWDGVDQVNLPAQLPPVVPKIKAVSPHPIRWAYQPATFAYASPYWNWTKWEREIDFLALSGITHALVLPGQEAIWQATWKAFGYSDDEIRKWLVMPAHAPFQSTGNMESYGGPVPQTVIDARLKLGQQIAKRMRELGIEPVLPGYYGIVPSDWKAKHAGAKVVAQGKWLDTFQRPDFLDPEDPKFAEISAKYYAALKQNFGETRFYHGDPFNDNGKTGDMNLVEVGKAIYAEMEKASPGVTWVLMATLEQPIGSLTFEVEKSNLLFVDMNADRKELWKDRKGFDDVAWIWGAQNADGGRSGMTGNLSQIANNATFALFNEESGNMVGIGATPHSGQNNAPFWDLMLENSWRGVETNAPQWLVKYPKRRYGQTVPGADRAWGLLRAAAYSRSETLLPPIASVRPYFVGPQFKPDDESHRRADMAQVYADAWRGLVDSSPQLDRSSGAETYRHDLAEVGANALDALAGRYQVEICKAYRAHDKATLQATGARLLGLMRDMDELLGTRREFLFGAWIDEARKWGTTPDEKMLCELDAKTILTTWSLPPTQRDYARRNWAGLISGYYLPRWSAWLTSLGESLDKKAPLDDKKLLDQIGALEIAWLKQPSKLAAFASGDTAQLSKKLLDKYAADFAQPPLMAVKTITGTWSPQETTTDKIVWMWDVSALMKSPGDYEAEFKFKSGDSGLRLYRVSLIQGTKEIAIDDHDGFANASVNAADLKRNTIYKLKAGTLNPDQPVTLRAEVSGDASGNSNGEIELRKAPRKDPRKDAEKYGE